MDETAILGELAIFNFNLRRSLRERFVEGGSYALDIIPVNPRLNHNSLQVVHSQNIVVATIIIVNYPPTKATLTWNVVCPSGLAHRWKKVDPEPRHILFVVCLAEFPELMRNIRPKWSRSVQKGAPPLLLHTTNVFIQRNGLQM